MHRTAALVLVLAACHPNAADPGLGYGFGVQPVVCHDEGCRLVERHLADLAAERLTYYQAVGKLLALGERAVPTLYRELSTESVQRLQISAYVLMALGHVDEVVAWCRQLGRDRDGRDLACYPD